MKFMYLGTAAAEGQPAVFCQCKTCREAARRGGKDLRFRSGALVNDNVLMDFSPDLYAAKLRFQLDLGNVRNILLTHAHMDHFNREDIGMYITPYAHMEHPGRLTLYGSRFTEKVWREFTDTMLLREARASEFIDFRVVAPFETFAIGDLRVTALLAVHSCPESLFYLLEQDGAAFLYANDTGRFPQETWDYLTTHVHAPLDVVSLDSTMGHQNSTYTGHMSLAQNIETRERMLAVGIADAHTRFICHHFSHNGMVLYDETTEEMKPHGFEISYDGMVITL